VRMLTNTSEHIGHILPGGLIVRDIRRIIMANP
jgi:hypothetical protein